MWDDGSDYLLPKDLFVQSSLPSEILFIGSCISQHISSAVANSLDVKTHFMHFGQMYEGKKEFPADLTPSLIVLNLPMDSLMHPFLDKRFATNKSDSSFLRRNMERRLLDLLNLFENFTADFKGPKLIMNFLTPQNSPLGITINSEDYFDPKSAVKLLNSILTAHTRKTSNEFILDIDELSAVHGRKFFQDDVVWSYSHGAFISDEDQIFENERRADADRPQNLASILEERTFNSELLIKSIAIQILGFWRIFTSQDQVKLVIVDLDDTLWRGHAGSQVEGDKTQMAIGMPLGVVESLAVLYERGILIAIASKNEENLAKKIWMELYEEIFPWNNFFTTKINWENKSKNIAEIIEEARLQDHNVVFIDDNPLERQEVKYTFPNIRVLGQEPWRIRSILLWSAEMQVLHLSEEAKIRKKSLQSLSRIVSGNIKRSREDMLDELKMELRVRELDGIYDKDFERVFELLNKTNQFNTTGKRYSKAELHEFFSLNSKILVIRAKDRFVDHGLIFVALFDKECLYHVVMSCRVIGLGIEYVGLNVIVDQSDLAYGSRFSAHLEETERNQPVRNYFRNAGFVQIGSTWTLDSQGQLLDYPKHLKVELE
jgi:FkbH-like protein